MKNPILRFFDKLEDAVRGRLSHYPIFYGFVGGIGVVLFWRGVWHTADYLVALLSTWRMGGSSINLEGAPWWDGPLSFAVGAVLLLVTGIFISNFIGNEIILTGLRGEKKLTEKTEQEVRTEVGAIKEIRDEVRSISKLLEGPEKERLKGTRATQ